MNLLGLIAVTVGCMFIQQPLATCVAEADDTTARVAGENTSVLPTPFMSGSSIDVVLTASAALVWDVKTDTVLYSKNIDDRRPVASLSKLVSVLTIRDLLPAKQEVEIPSEVKRSQIYGANIKLPVGEHTTVEDLLSASLVASANDAIVAAAIAASGDEESFAAAATQKAAELEMKDTKLANASGLSGGEQYSTARDMAQAMKLVYQDAALRPYLARKKDTLTTREGSVRSYESTNKLLGTYMPVIAAKTGYTDEAGENLVIITEGSNGQQIGAVILGSQQRFQDMKTLVEWIWRNYTWPQ